MTSFPTCLKEFDDRYGDEVSVIRQMMSEGLLASSQSCSKCGKAMTLRQRRGVSEWRCRSNSSEDCSTRSVRSSSFFANWKLPASKSLKMVIMYSQGYESSEMVAELDLSRKTVIEYRRVLRGLCSQIVDRYDRLGGGLKIVEIDVYTLTNRDYNLTGPKPLQWVIGGAERETGRSFLEALDSESPEAMMATLERKCRPDSLIVSKLAIGFHLGRWAHRHETFVNDDGVTEDGIAINVRMVEALWTKLRTVLQRGRGTTTMLLAGYLSEIVARDTEKHDFHSKLLEEIRRRAE